MPSFYFQIKGKKGEDDYSLSHWAFPPIYSNKVEAENKKHARYLIDIQFDKVFPTRVLAKDLASNEFLLSIEEIKPGSHIERLFELQTCKKCSTTFYVIDKYNDHHCTNKSFDYCSYECQRDAKQFEQYLYHQNTNLSGTSNPIIYKITNKFTSRVYIGKTTQVFTLRWYQHFFQHNGCKFHEAIKASRVIDWVFEIIEIVEMPADMKSIDSVDKLISDRERFWIQHYDSINNGYNSL